MKTMFSLLATDLRRALLSVQFAISVLSIAAVMLIVSSGFMAHKPDAVYLLDFALSGGSMIYILCIAPILPYGMSLAMDMEEKAAPFWLIRTGAVKYAASKFIASVISGYFSVFIGIIAYISAVSAFFPLFPPGSPDNSYAALLESNFPLLYFPAIASHYGLSAALFAGVSITVSAFIPNKYCVLASPVVLYFVLMLVMTFMPVHDFLKADFLIQRIYPDVSPFAAFAYKFVPVAVALGILLYATVRKTNARILAS